MNAFLIDEMTHVLEPGCALQRIHYLVARSPSCTVPASTEKVASESCETGPEVLFQSKEFKFSVHVRRIPDVR